MKTILLPTDFGKHSEKALDFAIQIAAKTQAKIIVVHSFILYATDAYVPSDTMGDMYQEEKDRSEKALMAYCEKISLKKDTSGQPLKTEYITQQNVAANEILSLIEAKKVNLIVMGTEHTSKLSAVFGSITLQVIHEATCPVLIVHENSTFTPFKKIYAALEDVSKDLPFITQALPLVRMFHATLSIVHVTETPFDMSDLQKNLLKKEAAELLLDEMKRACQYSDMVMNYSVSDHTLVKIDEILTLDSPDVLLLICKKRNWLEAIFHKSVIRYLLVHTETPLLILH